jgi:hypothetical protein
MLAGIAPTVEGDSRLAARPRASFEGSTSGKGDASFGALRTNPGAGSGARPLGVHAIRQAAPAMARSGPNRRIVMGPVLFIEDGPILVTKT